MTIRSQKCRLHPAAYELPRTPASALPLQRPAGCSLKRQNFEDSRLRTKAIPSHRNDYMTTEQTASDIPHKWALNSSISRFYTAPAPASGFSSAPSSGYRNQRRMAPDPSRMVVGDPSQIRGVFAYRRPDPGVPDSFNLRLQNGSYSQRTDTRMALDKAQRLHPPASRHIRLV